MMKLIGTRTSPYTRKARIVLVEKRIEYEFAIDIPYDAQTQVPVYNPLGKVPVLLLDTDNPVSHGNFSGLGGPYFDEYRDCEYSKEWFAERDAMLHAGAEHP